MDNWPVIIDSNREFLSGQNVTCLDDREDWDPELDDDCEDLDSFDLGVYAGALR